MGGPRTVLPADRVQRFLNKLANAEVGEWVEGLDAVVKKLDNDSYHFLGENNTHYTLEQMRGELWKD